MRWWPRHPDLAGGGPAAAGWVGSRQRAGGQGASGREQRAAGHAVFQAGGQQHGTEDEQRAEGQREDQGMV